MTDRPQRLGLLRIAIVLALVFNAMALLVLVYGTPIVFTLFMFLAQPLYAAALILLATAVVTEVRVRQIL